MTFISQPMDDHQEREAVPSGKYTLRINNWKLKQREDGVDKGILVIMEIDGEPDAKAVMFNFNLVLPDDDDNKRYWKLAFQKGFMKKFGLTWDSSGFDPDDWLGATSDLNLDQVTLDDGSVVNQIADGEIRPVT